MNLPVGHLISRWYSNLKWGTIASENIIMGAKIVICHEFDYLEWELDLILFWVSQFYFLHFRNQEVAQTVSNNFKSKTLHKIIGLF